LASVERAPASAPVAEPAETAAPDDDAPDGLDGLENMLADDALDMPGIPPLELDFDDDPDD